MDAASFSPQDAEAIFSLAERLTGNSVRGKLILANIARRMDANHCRNLFDYFRLIETSAEELPYLISGLVVHTTSWFREEPHFEKLSAYIEANLEKFLSRPMRILSGACSTGEEVFSIGLVLESYRVRYPGFDYLIEARDIDLLCVRQATKAVYSRAEMEKIPERYHGFLLEGRGKTRELFTVCDSIRQRVRFATWNLIKLEAEIESLPKFNFIFCRNVLIYFTPERVEQVVRSLLKLLLPEGALCLGHSESVDARKFGIESSGNSVYLLPRASLGALPEGASVGGRPDGKDTRSILIVDDSAAVRKVISRLLEGSEFRSDAVGSAAEASEYLKNHRVDLITLDLQMPGQDGLSWLARQRKSGLRTPVVIISDDFPSEATATFGAIETGAQDFFHKGQIVTGRADLLERFRGIIEGVEEGAGDAEGAAPVGELKLRRPELILAGASIGGPEALVKLFQGLPPEVPPILVCQHISAGFSAAFGEHLAQVAGLKRPKLHHGMPLEEGCLYISDGDYHIGTRRLDGRWILIVSEAPPVKRHRPSIDFLFSSPQLKSGLERVFAVLLTGMGSDGADGLLSLREAGAMTFAQERKSCVVFGMPREALRRGAVNYVGTPADIRRQLDMALKLEEPGDPGPLSGSSAR